MNLHTLLHINDTDSKCVSICGSGGKSSLCYALARESMAAGKRSAVTTTTHIAICNNDNNKQLFLSDNAQDLRDIISLGKVPIAGRIDGSKLCYGGKKQYDLLMKETDILYVEADGSKMLPIKFPNQTEPVLPVETGLIIVVCGLSAYAKPLSEVCHRYKLAQSRIPGINEIADADTIATILWNGYQRFSPVFVLNQADTIREISAGEEIKNLLECWGAKQVHILSLKNHGLAAERFF